MCDSALALISKRAYSVTQSDYVSGRKWTERERQALIKRHLATPHAESKKSIACSFGKTLKVIQSQIPILCDPTCTKPSGTSSANTGFKIGYRRLLPKIMLTLPDQQGTVSQIYTAFEQLPQVPLLASVSLC